MSDVATFEKPTPLIMILFPFVDETMAAWDGFLIPHTFYSHLVPQFSLARPSGQQPAPDAGTIHRPG